jgi:hypothetical protein
MTATLAMVPLAEIRPQKSFNPRTDFADEQIDRLEAVRLAP